MLSINDLKKGTNITLKGEPYTVVSSMHVKMGRGGGVMQTRLKNLITGQVTEKNFKGQETIEPAELSRKKAQYLYLDQDGAHFMDQENFETITVPRDNLLNQTDYLKEGALVSVLTFKNDPVSIGLPVKVELKVKSAPPVTKGNTASGGGTKPVELETGATVSVPLFIKAGDTIRVNTETGEYVERVS